MSAPAERPAPALPMFAEDAFPSRVRDHWLVVRLGAMLGAAITVCFLTGLISHLHQHPVGWLPLPADPVWAYRVTQGVHVAAGLATIPIFGAKLWTVYPRLFSWPPASSLVDGARRLSVGLLAAATGFELVTGVFNLAHLYVWSFLFPVAHYAVAWVVVGSVLLHLAIQWPQVVEGWRSQRPANGPRAEGPEGRTTTTAGPESPSISRRTVLWATVGAAGAITATTIGQTLRPLGWAGVLAPRSPQDVPGGIPINRTAADAGVLEAASDPTYAVTIAGPRGRAFTLAELAALPQVQAELPIACVEGWSALGTWSGVRLRDVLDICGIPSDAAVRVVSLERDGLYSSAVVPAQFAQHPTTLLATQLGGEALSLDHGYPVRLIAPNQPGVLQTKWVHRVELA